MAKKILKLTTRNNENIRRADKESTHNLFRMPWSMSYNAFTWLEITRRCDLNCSYCYQKSDPTNDKSLFQIEMELIVMLGLRKTDTVFITGGEPLLHPDLEAIVKMVSSYRVKPVLMTNGNRLNEDKVCTNTIIPVRVLGSENRWDLYVNHEKIDYADTAFSTRDYASKTHKDLTSSDLINQVKKVIPNFTANAFLGGTEVPDAPKWLFSNVVGTKDKVYGFIGSNAMELMLNGYHFLKERYLSFLKPFMYGMGKMMFPLSIMDRGIRKSFLSYITGCLNNPLNLFRKVYVQSLLILQPQDILEDGR
jgi:hypothetical protein